MSANTTLDNPAEIIDFLRGKAENSPRFFDGYRSPRRFHRTE